MCGYVELWMNEFVGGWMFGWMDVCVWMDASVDECVVVCMDLWVDSLRVDGCVGG